MKDKREKQKRGCGKRKQKNIFFLSLLSVTTVFPLLSPFCCSFILPVYAWNSDAHHKIVYAAVHAPVYPEDLKKFLNRNAGLLADFSAKPDFENKMTITNYDLEHCRHKINELVGRILSGQKAKILAENMGRLSHYLSDCNHPLLMEELDPKGKEVYARYETDRSQNAELKYDTGLKTPQHVESIEELIDKISQEANAGYQSVMQSYSKSGSQIQAVSKLTQDRITASVQTTMDVWLTLWNLKESEPLKEQVLSNPTVNGFVKLIDLYSDQNRKNETIEIFREAYSRFGSEERLIHAEIKFYFMGRDFSKAVSICQSALKENPSSLDLKYQLAVIYEHWLSQGGRESDLLKEKAIAEWSTLLGTRFDSRARERIEKLKTLSK